jgi:hypothetical protein
MVIVMPPVGDPIQVYRDRSVPDATGTTIPPAPIAPTSATDELRILVTALREIDAAAPLEEPSPPVTGVHGSPGIVAESYGYQSGLWVQAEIARRALEAVGEGRRR